MIIVFVLVRQFIIRYYVSLKKVDKVLRLSAYHDKPPTSACTQPRATANEKSRYVSAAAIKQSGIKQLSVLYYHPKFVTRLTRVSLKYYRSRTNPSPLFCVDFFIPHHIAGNI